MQNRNHSALAVTITLMVAVLFLVFLPWLVELLFTPLQPSALALTPTAYASIAADYNTRQAATDRARPSVLSTVVEPTDTPTDLSGATSATATLVSFSSGETNPGVMLVPQHIAVAFQVAPSPTDTVSSSDASSPTPTIKLPVIYTATPLPPVAQHIELTDQQASAGVQQQRTDIQNLQVNFLSDAVKITGTVPVVGPLNVTIMVGIEIDGKLILDNGKLVMQVTSIVAGGKDQTDSGRQQAESLIDDWLTSFLVQETVVSYQVTPGKLMMDVLQFSTSDMPTLPPSPTPTITTCLPLTPIVVDGQATPNLTETVVPLDNITSEPCPPLMVLRPEVTESGSNYTLPTVVSPAPTNTDGSVTLTNAQATVLSGGSIGPLHNAQISFSPSGITIAGELDVSQAANNVIPLGLNVAAVPVTINGQLTLMKGRPHLTAASISVANQSAIQIKGDAIFQAVDGWLSALLPGNFSTLKMGDGSLNAAR